MEGVSSCLVVFKPPRFNRQYACCIQGSNRVCSGFAAALPVAPIASMEIPLTSNRKRHLRIEVALASVAAICLAATLAWPHWIEDVSGSAHDGDSGTTEWSWCLAFLLTTIVSSVVARVAHQEHHA
jgi:hypothetical protein